MTLLFCMPSLSFIEHQYCMSLSFCKVQHDLIILYTTALTSCPSYSTDLCVAWAESSGQHEWTPSTTQQWLLAVLKQQRNYSKIIFIKFLILILKSLYFVNNFFFNPTSIVEMSLYNRRNNFSYLFFLLLKQKRYNVIYDEDFKNENSTYHLTF